MARDILFAALLLCLNVFVGEACFSSGICGGGFACAPPIAAPICAGGCGPGYACGQYGCYSRARARSSKTFRFATMDSELAPNTAPVSRRQGLKAELTADEQFYDCCLDRQLPDTCLQKCSYEMYTRNALQAMYLHYDNCPLQALADISYCAARGQDHTQCCMRNGVTTTLAGPKCLTFCDQRPGNVTQLDMSYLPCYDRFDNIKSCFMEYINSENPRPSTTIHLARTFET